MVYSAMTLSTPAHHAGGLDNTPSALDFRDLAQLRLGVKKQEPGLSLSPQTRAVARQFEALFLQLMLKRMREASPRTGFLESDQTRLAQGLADEQLAQQLANPGIGLAQALLRQIQGQTEAALPPAASIRAT